LCKYVQVDGRRRLIAIGRLLTSVCTMAPNFLLHRKFPLINQPFEREDCTHIASRRWTRTHSIAEKTDTARSTCRLIVGAGPGSPARPYMNGTSRYAAGGRPEQRNGRRSVAEREFNAPAGRRRRRRSPKEQRQPAMI
jgi:hypothetical protein